MDSSLCRSWVGDRAMGELPDTTSDTWTKSIRQAMPPSATNPACPGPGPGPCVHPAYRGTGCRRPWEHRSSCQPSGTRRTILGVCCRSHGMLSISTFAALPGPGDMPAQADRPGSDAPIQRALQAEAGRSRPKQASGYPSLIGGSSASAP